MSKRDHNLFLEDMLDAIEAISRYTNSLDIKSFIDDRKTVDAVIRNLEILGEPANQVPESFKNKNVNIDWRGMIGLHNSLIHGYFGVDENILWQIIQSDLPDLKSQLIELQSKLVPRQLNES